MGFRLAGSLAGNVIVMGALLTLAACGGDEATSTPVLPTPTDTAVPTVNPTATAAPTTTPGPTATTVPAPTEAPIISPPTPAPTATLTPEPTPTPVLLKSVDEFGFVLKLDKGADVESAGWTEPEPDVLQGFLSLTSGGVDVILIWGPQLEREPLSFLADTYNILRGSQPDLTFESISEDEITVSSEAGIFGGFKALDADGATAGGGLIGAWVCAASETAFRLILTGEDATLVQLRFVRLLEKFTCPS